MHPIAATFIRSSIAEAKIEMKAPPEAPTNPIFPESIDSKLSNISTADSVSRAIQPIFVIPTSSGANWPC